MDKIIKILLVEDDRNLGYILKSYLMMRGYPTTLCFDGNEALKHYENEVYDFIISGINLDGMDGFSFAKKIRENDEHIPFVFLTSKSSRIDVSRGFEVGADDYVTKPFSMEELLDRVKAISRRAAPKPRSEHEYQLGTYTFDTIRHVLIRNGNVQRLTHKEMDLLYLFCEYRNRVIERTFVLQRLWNKANYFSARNMDVYINKLRKLLQDDPNVEIQNVHGIGYKLVVRA